MSVRLDVMTEDEYNEYVPYVVSDYAERNVRAGTWPSAGSLKRAREDFDRLLPQGHLSTDNYLYTARDPDTETNVGNLWYAMRGAGDERNAFILNMEVSNQLRGKGYGRAMLEACARSAVSRGAKSLGIQVLGPDESSRRLFRSVGMIESRVVMSWDLGKFE